MARTPTGSRPACAMMRCRAAAGMETVMSSPPEAAAAAEAGAAVAPDTAAGPPIAAEVGAGAAAATGADAERPAVPAAEAWCDDAGVPVVAEPLATLTALAAEPPDAPRLSDVPASGSAVTAPGPGPTPTALPEDDDGTDAPSIRTMASADNAGLTPAPACELAPAPAADPCAPP